MVMAGGPLPAGMVRPGLDRRPGPERRNGDDHEERFAPGESGRLDVDR